MRKAVNYPSHMKNDGIAEYSVGPERYCKRIPQNKVAETKVDSDSQQKHQFQVVFLLPHDHFVRLNIFHELTGLKKNIYKKII